MQPVREVYSLLMPVSDGRVILPRAAIAEVTGYTRPKDRPDGAPSFVLGFIEWQNQRIPLVSFEAARGQAVPELGRRTRIAVLFGIANRLNPNVFAVVTQGYPYLVRVNENVLQREELDGDEPLVLARVRMANEKPYIPDLEKLEVLIADALGIDEAPVGATAPAEPVDELDAIDAGEEDAGFDALLVEEPAGEDAESGATSANDIGEETIVPDDVNLDEVTAFGTETNYSAELDDLSSALESGDTSDGDAEGDEFAVDLSGFEVEGEPADDDDGEIDFSDLEIDLDDDNEKEK